MLLLKEIAVGQKIHYPELAVDSIKPRRGI
jgi:hypothetical protein